MDVIKSPASEVCIGIVGKYVELTESYKSLNEALVHGGIANNCKANLKHIDSEEVETRGAEAMLGGLDAILVPGGFGSRGIEGKILAVQYAREKKLPYFGICLGMHMAVIEFARNVVGLGGANTVEIDPKSAHPVISIMEDQATIEEKGGTMRLGAYPCVLGEGTLAQRSYQVSEISERHRHRFEFNNDYREKLEGAGMVLSGMSPDGNLVEMVEIPDHPYFIACQFHPEFKSRPTAPHPLFTSFIKAALDGQAP